MAIVTATEVTVYTDISVSAGTITSSGLIPIVQDRINKITNNYFTSDMVYYNGTVTFSATAYTITAETDLGDLGFYDNDEFYLHGSFRNDGYYTAETVADEVITIASTESVIAEPSGASILIGLVEWPVAIPYIAAQMIKYDYDDRPSRALGVMSETLGPYSTSYGTDGFKSQTFGYPQEIIEALAPFTAARLV